jgi:hypothetical protein
MLRWLFASFSTKAWELYCDAYLLSYLLRLWALCYDELHFPYKWGFVHMLLFLLSWVDADTGQCRWGCNAVLLFLCFLLLLQIWHGKWFYSFCYSISEFLCISKLVNEEFLLVASWSHCRWMILCASMCIFMRSGPWCSQGSPVYDAVHGHGARW